MKQIFITLLTLISLTACGETKEPVAVNNMQNNKSIVIYFSHAGENYSVGNVREGNTKLVADVICEQVGADRFEIECTKDYNMGYSALCDLAKQEQQNGELPEFMGGKVRVKVERVTWKSINTPVKGTDLVSETDMVINNGSLTVPVKVESELYGYRVFITPLNVPQFPFNNEAATIPGKIEAENYDVAGPGFSFFDNDSENKGKEYRDDAVDIVTASEGGYAIGYTEKGEWLEYTVNVEDDKEYDVTAYVSNSAVIDGFQLFVDDERITDDYTIPQVSENWSLYEEVPVVSGVKMTKGEHVLKLQIVGSYVNVDWLKFTEHDKTSADLVLDYNDIVNISGLQIYDVNGKLLSVNDLRCYTIYIATTPDLRSFKFIKR